MAEGTRRPENAQGLGGSREHAAKDHVFGFKFEIGFNANITASSWCVHRLPRSRWQKRRGPPRGDYPIVEKLLMAMLDE
jgi:hypothetical protein